VLFDLYLLPPVNNQEIVASAPSFIFRHWKIMAPIISCGLVED